MIVDGTRWIIRALPAIAAVYLCGCLADSRVPCGSGYCLDGYLCVVISEGTGESACLDSSKQPGICGNGLPEIDLGEVCDDGNTTGGDECSSNCLSLDDCGNGIIDPGEDCDCGIGNIITSFPGCAGLPNTEPYDGGYCSLSCSLHCGDGQVGATEVCDPGDLTGIMSCLDLRYDFGRPGCLNSCDALDLAPCGDFNWRPLPASIPMPMPTGSVVLSAIWVSSSGEVFAAGNNGTVLHYDGQSWQAEGLATISQRLNAVWGADPNNVFAAGDGGVIIQYDGRSWQLMQSGISVALRAIWGSGPYDVFAAGDGGIILRYDGLSWKPMPSGTSVDLLGLWGSGPGNVFAVGREETVLQYKDQSWQVVQTIPGSPIPLYSVWGSGPNDVFAVGGADGGEGMGLHFDGQSWQPMLVSSRAPLRGIWGTSSNHVFAVGERGNVLHYDGRHWQSAPLLGTLDSLHSVWGSNAENIYAVSTSGMLVHYDGQSWERFQAPTNQRLRGIWGSSISHVLMIGEDGALVRYDGKGWPAEAEELERFPLFRPTSVWGSSPTDVFVAGDGILHFDGTDWELMTLPKYEGTLQGLWGSGPRDVFAVSDEGEVLHYNGTVWERMAVPSGTHLADVWGIGPEDVFAVGDGILRYNGTSWERMDPPKSTEPTQLSGVWGSSPDSVFAVGERGSIFYFDGMVWTRSFAPTTARLLDVWGSGPDDVFAVGEAGTVLHYDGVGDPVSFMPIRTSELRRIEAVWGDTAAGYVFMVGDEGSIYRLTRPPERTMSAP